MNQNVAPVTVCHSVVRETATPTGPLVHSLYDSNQAMPVIVMSLWRDLPQPPAAFSYFIHEKMNEKNFMNAKKRMKIVHSDPNLRSTRPVGMNGSATGCMLRKQLRHG